MSLQSFTSLPVREQLARMIDAEAGRESLQGKLAVGAVIDNRRRTGGYGDGWTGVMTKPGQFSAINNLTGYARGAGHNNIVARPASSESRRVADLVLSGQYKDPTNGATHYYNPAGVKGGAPSWARGKQFDRIGNHVFGNADAGRAPVRQSIQFDPNKLEAARQAPVVKEQAPAANGFDPAKLEAARGGSPSAERPNEQPEPSVQTTAPNPPKGMVEMKLPNGESYFVDTRAVAEQRLQESFEAQAGGASGNFISGIPFVGEYADEFAGFIDERLGGVPGLRTELSRALKEEYARLNPRGAALNQMAGGVLGGAPMVMASAPIVAGSAPASIPGQVAYGLGAGAAAGAIEGGVSGFGEGTGDLDNRLESARDRALSGAIVGGATGAGVPVVALGARKIAENVLPNRAGQVARQQDVAPEAVELTGEMLNNDGADAAARLNTPDAMLADAGPSTAGLLDAAIQKAGPAGRIAREAIEQRTQRASANIDEALNSAFGRPGPGTEVIVRGDKNPLGRLYDMAYERPVDYSNATGRELESILDRVPMSVIRRAEELMAMEGRPSAQRLVQIAEDGTETLSRLPDVRELDYITRSLNDVAQRGDGRGALGGNTNEGRIYAKLSREIRGLLRENVPEYATAVNRAANEISLKQARDLGEAALSARTSRGDLSEAVADMGEAEVRQLRRGVREHIDNVLANVKRTAMDSDTASREGLQALKELSSRASREKLQTILGQKEARNLTRRLDNASRAFELRARTADNSKTFARLSMDEAIKDLTDPGALGKLMEGSPQLAAKRVIQRISAMTPEARREVEGKIAGDIARILTESTNPQQRLRTIVTALDRDVASRELANKIGMAFGQITASVAPQLEKLR